MTRHITVRQDCLVEIDLGTVEDEILIDELEARGFEVRPAGQADLAETPALEQLHHALRESYLRAGAGVPVTIPARIADLAYDLTRDRLGRAA